MAGTSPTFDGDDFRAKIRAVMLMGLPPNEADRPTFYFEDPSVYTPSDMTGNPYDLDQVPDNAPVTQPEGVQVLCAIQGPNSEGEVASPIGVFNVDLNFLMFFEDEWEQVKEFTHATIGGDIYARGKKLRPTGLYDVQIHRVYLKALDHA